MVFITGDCHGKFNFLEDFCRENETTRDDILIVLGDAGINYYLNKTDRKLKQYISSLPINISRQNTIFDNGENAAKFSTGPTAAIPGPTLFIVVNTPLNDVAKSKLSIEINNTETINITMYAIK